MKCQKPGTDQTVEFAIYANGRKCNEYEPVAKLFASDPDTLECIVPVEGKDTITIEGVFQGSVLHACVDVLGDGSFIAGKEVVKSQVSSVNFHVDFSDFFSVQASSQQQQQQLSQQSQQQQQLSRGDLTLDPLKRSVGFMTGTTPGVGTIVVIVSASQKGDENDNNNNAYVTHYPDCSLGAWKDRGDPRHMCHGGVQPKHQLQLRLFDHDLQAEKQMKHQQRFTDKRPGSKPLVRFIFYYRGMDSFRSSQWKLRSEDSQALSPLQAEEFMFAGPGDQQQPEAEERSHTPRRRRDTLFVSPPSPEREPAAGRRKSTTGTPLKLPGRKRKHSDERHNFGGPSESRDDGYRMLPHRDDEEAEDIGADVFRPRSEETIKLRPHTSKPSRTSTSKPTRRMTGGTNTKSNTKSKDPLRRVRDSGSSSSKVKKSMPERTAEPVSSRLRLSDLKIPPADALGTRTMAPHVPSLDDIREAFPADDGLTSEELYHHFRDADLPIDKLFELVDNVATLIDDKYFLQRKKHRRRSKRHETNPEEQEQHEEEKGADADADEHESENEGGFVVRESNFSRNNPTLTLLRDSLPARARGVRRSLVSYVNRAEQIVDILHNRMDRQYENHGITQQEIDDWEAMDARRVKVEAARRAHAKVEMRANVETQVRARIDAEVKLQLELMRFSKPALDAKLDKARRERAILEQIRYLHQTQAVRTESQEQGAQGETAGEQGAQATQPSVRGEVEQGAVEQEEGVHEGQQVVDTAMQDMEQSGKKDNGDNEGPRDETMED